ncbi:MAG: hypothetical protein J0L57_14135 [Burkholderiales bacterium]|nr:hypothetical protein [Burkholderiales bacterium]
MAPPRRADYDRSARRTLKAPSGGRNLTFRYAAFQVLTWGTVAGAVVCAVLLAMFDKPLSPLDGSYTLSTLWPPTSAGLASAGTAASAPAGRRR